MAWSTTRKTFGVCGNFKFEIWDLTDVKATRSLVKPMMSQVHFVSTTNTSDNADLFSGKTLNWTGTADSNDANQLTDTSETFEKGLTGLQVFNNTDAVETPTSISGFGVYSDTDTLDITHAQSAFDLFPDGNETFGIKSERVVQLIAVTAGDDGTMLLIGK